MLLACYATKRLARFDAFALSCPLEQVGADGDIGKSSFVSAEASESERPELTSAKVIVSGGRAFGSSGRSEPQSRPYPEGQLWRT